MPEITVFIGYVAAAALLAAPAWRPVRPSLFFRAFAIALVSVLAHGWLLWQSVKPDNVSLGTTVSLSGWMLAVIALSFVAQVHLRTLIAVFIFGAGICVLSTGTAGTSMHGSEPQWQFLSHVLIATLAYSLFAAAAVLALLTIAKDRYLKHTGVGTWARALPPLESIERLMFGSITIGFVLLSLAIFSGLIFVDNLAEQHLTHKTILTLLAWVLFAVLLLGRWRLGWRGRTATNWTIGGFTVLLLAYFGSRIILEVILGRHWG